MGMGLWRVLRCYYCCLWLLLLGVEELVLMEEVGVGESSFLVEAEAYVAAYLGKVVVVGMVVAVHQGTCAEEVGDAVVVA